MEIKFRVWDKNYKTMYYPTTNLFIDWDKQYGSKLLCEISNEKGKSDCADSEYEIMQYTTFKDDSGKDAYEGDITDDGRIIIWHKGAFWLKQINGDGSFPLHFLISGKLDRMIVGNKFQNPELITQIN